MDPGVEMVLRVFTAQVFGSTPPTWASPSPKHPQGSWGGSMRNQYGGRKLEKISKILKSALGVIVDLNTFNMHPSANLNYNNGYPRIT